jgi:hypothetical protein
MNFKQFLRDKTKEKFRDYFIGCVKKILNIWGFVIRVRMIFRLPSCYLLATFLLSACFRGYAVASSFVSGLEAGKKQDYSLNKEKKKKPVGL